MQFMKNKKVLIGAAAALVLALAAVALFVWPGWLNGGGQTGAGSATPTDATATDLSGDNPVVRISVRNVGDIYAELYPAAAPITVENFLSLVDRGFYDGLTFHRVITGFMIQGGDPAGNGTGGSDKNIKGEFATNGWDNPISHERGVLSMARATDPDSGSSQFFIMHADNTGLDGQYAAFGRVLAGMGVVDRIANFTYVTDNNGTVGAGHAPVIESIRRASRADAQAAIAAEGANGAAGGTFTDPATGLTFRLPGDWAMSWTRNGQADFTPEGAEAPVISLSTMDYWGYAAGVSAGETMEGHTRAETDTSFFTKEMMVSLVNREDPDSFTEETRGGVRLYRATLDTEQAAGAHYALGATNGVVFAFIADNEAGDALNAMLDTLTVP